MKAIKFVVIIFVILAVLLGIRAYKHHEKIRKAEEAVLALRNVNYEELYKTNPPKIYEDLDKHWNATVGAYLKDELWYDAAVYDAGHFLMVPLHAAYKLNKADWQKDFRNHFERFKQEGGFKNIDKRGILNDLHYAYLLSWYVVLEKNDPNVESFADDLYTYVDYLWNQYPAWQWEHNDFNGMKGRFDWKLQLTNPEHAYYKAIIDEENFTLAIAANLRTYFKSKSIEKPVLDEILETTHEIYKEFGTFDKEGRWLFQIGVWSDHPDFYYAGYEKLENVIDGKIKLNPKQAFDSSHFHRTPLYMKGFILASSDKPEYQALFKKISHGIEKQLIDKIISYSDELNGYLLTNFMDGTNGVYRWNYSTTKGTGYGPYELSGTFLIGWWTFLDSDRVGEIYTKIADSFPLNPHLVKVYVGPNTSRERNSLIKDPDSFFNGYKHILTKLAGLYSRD